MVSEDTKSPGWEALEGHGFLAEAERRYLATGETGSYQERDLKNRIEAKIEKIPTEFEALETDIRLLSREAGYLTDEDGNLDPEKLDEEPAAHFLTSERWEAGWWSLLGVSDGPPDSVAEICQELVYSSLDSDQPESAPTTFGRRIGEMVSELMLFPRLPVEAESEASIRRQLVWGFVQGAYISPLLNGAYSEGRLERIEELTDALQKWASHSHQVLYEEPRQEGVPIADAVNTSLQIYARVADILSVREETTEWLLEQAAMQLVEEHRREQEMASEEKVGSQKVVEEFVTESKVDAVIEANKLDVKQELRAQLAADVDALQGKQWKGLRGLEVFQAIFEAGKISSSGVARRLGDEHSYKSLVTRLARDFAGIDCKNRPGETWEDRPLVVGDRDGWQPTAYGRALGHFLDEKDDSKPLTEEPPDEVLEAALEEVELDG